MPCIARSSYKTPPAKAGSISFSAIPRGKRATLPAPWQASLGTPGLVRYTWSAEQFTTVKTGQSGTTLRVVISQLGGRVVHAQGLTGANIDGSCQ